MIALDTNVLVRTLVEDDPSQSRRAHELLEAIRDRDDRAFVSDIVLCEVVWVLERSYRIRRKEISEALELVLATRNLVFREIESAARALRRYAKGRGDFADYLIQEQARQRGCDAVVTFDRELLKEDGFVEP